MRQPDKERMGLSHEEVLTSRRTHGDNRLPENKRETFFRRVLGNLTDPIIRILIAALLLNILLNFRHINWAECAGIIISILISSFVSAASEYGSEKAFEKLQQASRNEKATVLRAGEKQEISVDELVVGDLICIAAGEQIPCDGYLLEGKLRLDESALNGESREAEKLPTGEKSPLTPGKPNVLLRGAFVCGGQGIMSAQRVGKETLYGQIAADIQADPRESPMKLRLQKLANAISKIGYGAAALVALTYLFNVFVIDSGFQKAVILARFQDWRFLANAVIHAMTIAITVIVVAVPEGLPMMITVVLSSNMKRLLRGGVLVRKLVGIETAGSLNLLFTDKTGTITGGKLSCECFLSQDGSNISWNTQIASAILAGNPCSRTGNGTILGGNATDRALFAALPVGYSETVSASRVIPFDSDRKYTAAQVGKICYYRGAPELLLAYCTQTAEGEYLSEAWKRQFKEKLNKLAGQSRRLLLLASYDGKLPQEDEQIPSGLILLAIAVLRDPVRKTAHKAVSQLQGAGIGIIMITGDSLETATAIATESGILTNDRSIRLESVALSGMSDYEVKAVLPHLALVARALPGDKVRLVRLAQEQGLVVGMTGDGINDAPALRLADVGFAMGKGTEIAKEAGDILLLQEDLRSICHAVLYGRTIFHSIRKFILFQLTMNLCAVGVSFFGQLMGIDNPVTMVQMLWINLIMDTLGGLAFAGEPALEKYLLEKPKKREEPILTGSMLGRVLIVGGFATAVCTGFLGSERLRSFYGFYRDPIYFLTAYFALFIFFGIMICFVSRREDGRLLAGIGKNKPFLLIMTGITLIQLLMLYFGGSVFRCIPLSPTELLPALLLPLLVIPADRIRLTLSNIKNNRKNRKKTRPSTCKKPSISL